MGENSSAENLTGRKFQRIKLTDLDSETEIISGITSPRCAELEHILNSFGVDLANNKVLSNNILSEELHGRNRLDYPSDLYPRELHEERDHIETLINEEVI